MSSSFRYQTCAIWLINKRVLTIWMESGTFSKVSNVTIHQHTDRLIYHLLCTVEWLNLNFRNFLRQKKVLCVRSKMQMLHFYFVGQLLVLWIQSKRADIRKAYRTVVSDFRTHCYLIVQYVCMLEIWNVPNFSSQCFGYHIHIFSFTNPNVQLVTYVRRHIQYHISDLLWRFALRLAYKIYSVNLFKPFYKDDLCAFG